MQKHLKTYLRRLTNLTSRNRSLLLLNLPQEQFLDLNELNFLDGKPSFEYISQLIAQKATIPLCDMQDSRLEKVNEISKRLRKIARTEAFIEEERGSEDLYVGYPFVKGKLSDGTVVRCPLLFFPVTLKNSGTPPNGKKWILEKRDEAVSLNRSFLLAYSHFNQIRISDEFLETTFEDFDKVSLVFRTQLYELLKESQTEINFNQDLFTDQLVDYQKLTKADLELSELNGELKLFSQAVLGIFPQAGSYLVPDYEALLTPPLPLPDGEGYNKENIFFKTLPIGEGREGLVKEETTFLPFAVDASQEAAIKQVKEGKSLVVQGPPGTGKSQLIANLVTDFTARGKRVLVVCQKRVALDTVFQRLEKVKMGNFVALIHDFKNDRKTLFEKIANQIEQIDDYQKKNKGLDAIFLERNFTQISRRIDKISEELQGFKNALFDETICGLSVKELYLTSSFEKPYIDLKNVYKSFVFNELVDFEGRMKRYFQYEEKLRESDGFEFWNNRVSFAKFTNADLSKIIGTVEDVESFQAKNTTNFSLIALNSFDEKQVEQFLKLLENIDIVKIFEAILYEKKYLENRQFDLTKIKAEIENIYANAWIETTLSSSELVLRKIQVEKAYLASKSGLSWFMWKLFSKDKKDLEKLVFQNKLSLQTADLELLSKKIDNRIAFEHIKEKLAKKDILIDAQDDFDLINQTLKNYILANKANVIYQVNDFLQKPDFSLPYYHYLETLIIETKQKMLVWKLHLTEEQIAASDDATSELSIRFLRQNFDYLVEADQLKELFSRTEGEVVEKLNENPKEAIAIFQNSLRLAWVEHIENLYPILRSVSSLKMGQLEEELQESVKQKQILSQEILLLKLREQTYKDLVINRLQNVVTYRELQHQTTKKRKLWSVRKVLENYSDEIFKLIPCWMASPEAVSAIFPMNVETDEKLFDLVIFDEASQCFAEYGIPAIFRGKQVLIAGDSKQLQPNDLYQIRYEEDLIDEPILEIDSLLDLAAQYLPQVSLQGHYRSRSLDLIDFSNQFFYKNTLRLLPDYEEINKNMPSINYIKVEGIWEKNTNEIEAQKVFEIVRDLQEISPEKSIGVVTFNHKQAELIELRVTSYELRMMDEARIMNQKDKYSQVSIKNIENIQGDEFDIVIFSVGYAPDAQGKMLMNFGSLNQQGGENRLNVGITRAREKIYIVSSIFPNQLRVEDAQNQGPKLLKKYLEYALEVSNGKYFPNIIPNENFRTAWFLKEQLKSANPLYVSELPFADITVKTNIGKYESLILTDDDLYYASISPKEAHAYLPINLQEKGWKVERLWSRKFVK